MDGTSGKGDENRSAALESGSVQHTTTRASSFSSFCAFYSRRADRSENVVGNRPP